MATPVLAERLVVRSALAPDAFIVSLREAAGALSQTGVPAALRAVRIVGVTMTVRGRSFFMLFVRGRRVLAPLVCRGRVVPTDDGGCVVHASIRPSRRWMILPATGSLLLAVSWMLIAVPPSTTLRYALLVGALWALNLGLVAVPVGADPAAEHAGYVALLERAANQAPPA
jgi:hypothetical protein